MGRLKSKLRSAQRPGAHERRRVKKSRSHTEAMLVSGGTLVRVKAGRKKWLELHRSKHPSNPWSLFHPVVNRRRKSNETIIGPDSD